MLALDHDRRDLRAKFSYFADPALQGPMPVDDDKDGALAREAVKGHLANFRMPDFITEFKFRDDPLPYDPSFTTASFSPYHYLDEIPQDVAVSAISVWIHRARPPARGGAAERRHARTFPDRLHGRQRD